MFGLVQVNSPEALNVDSLEHIFGVTEIQSFYILLIRKQHFALLI